MSVLRTIAFRPMVGDPDDHRPQTEWALVFDPPRDDDPYVRDLTCILERIAPGDVIPLHTHTTDEVVFVHEGRGSYRLGDEQQDVGSGAVVFIPAGTPHGTQADHGSGMTIFALFPAATIDIAYLERNPAPGTEADPPQPPMRFDPRIEQP